MAHPRRAPVHSRLLPALVVACAAAACFNPHGTPGDTQSTSSTAATTGATLTSEPTSTGMSVAAATTDAATTSSSSSETSGTGSTTTPAVCGDGIMSTGEQCDDGNTEDSDACVNCQKATCGDDYVQTGVEECDDGNLDDDDGCTASCSKERTIFVTSTATYMGWIDGTGGVAAADEACRTAAASSTLPDVSNNASNYIAWLSAANTPVLGRLGSPKGPYHTPSGIEVVLNLDDLLQGNLSNPIVEDESGMQVATDGECNGATPMMGRFAWTGTIMGGDPSEPTCNGWTSNAGEMGRAGDITAMNIDWTQGCASMPCEKLLRLYCIEKE